MGLTARYFWLDERDEVHGIALRKWHRIMDGEESAPAFAGQRLVVVEAIVDVNGRQVVGVVRMVAWRCAFDERGRMDRARDEARMRLTVETLDYPSLERKCSPRPVW
jgi:hypothetical protein